MTTQANLGKVWAITGGVTDPGASKYSLGWESEIPTFQHFNYVLQNHDKNILVLAEQAAFDWQVDITYSKGAEVKFGSTLWYSTIDNNTANLPGTGSTQWRLAPRWGGTQTLSHWTGLILDDVTGRLTGTWSGQDATIIGYAGAKVLLGAKSPYNNLLFGNHLGELVVKDVGLNIEPDNSSLTVGSGSMRIYHEGHKPTQAEVANTIPANANDGILYGRKDGNWVKVTTTTIAEFPPQPVEGNGAGWYNLQDGQMYIDINDGDSSQWVPACSPFPPIDDSVKRVGDAMSGNLSINSGNYTRLDLYGTIHSVVNISQDGVNWGSFMASADEGISLQVGLYSNRNAIYKFQTNGLISAQTTDDDFNARDTPTPVLEEDLVNKKYADGTSTQAEDGFTKLPNGVMMVWGKLVSTIDGAESFNFNTAFPNACFNLQVTAEGTGGSGYLSGIIDNKSSFTVKRSDVEMDGNRDFFYYAIGN